MNTDEKLCLYCGETIKAIAVKCKHCKQDLSASSPPINYRVETVVESRQDFRKLSRQGASSALLNYDAIGMVFSEIVTISIIVGIYKQNWIVFGGTIVFLSILMFVPILNYIFAIAISVFWGYCGFLIGELFSQNAQFILAAFCGIASILIHWYAIQYTRDFTDNS